MQIVTFYSYTRKIMFDVYIQEHIVNQVQINRSTGQMNPNSETDTNILNDMANLKWAKTG